MHINSTNNPAYADKTAGLPKTRDARDSNAPERADSDAKQPNRDAFIPSRQAEDNGIYKPPAANQANRLVRTDTSPETGAGDPAGLKLKPQINEILAKIKATNPEDLLSAQQQAVSENIAALLENDE